MKLTEKQRQYLVILMNKSFGNFRKLIIKEKYGINSTSEFDKDTASFIIDKLVNNDENYIAECKEIAYKSIGQKSLF